MARDEAYLKAEKKIEEIRRSKAEEINFSYMRLTELPKSLGTLSQLKTLVLSHNQLKEVPETIGQLQNLKRIYLF